VRIGVLLLTKPFIAVKLPLFIVILAALVLSACAAAPDPTDPLPPAQLEAARRAKELFDRGNYREAAKIYEGIVAVVPNNLYSLSNLGVARFRSGKLQLAEEAIRRAINVAPNDAYSHMILGIIYYCQNRYDEAIAPLKRAVELEPNNATAHNYLGCLYTAVGMAEEAAKEFEVAKKLDPKYGEGPAPAPPAKELRIHEA